MKIYLEGERNVLFEANRSCAALRAADLGLSGQDAFQVLIFRHTHGVTTDHHDTE